MSLRDRSPARHARPSRTAPMVAVGGLALAFVATDAAALATSASAASDADFARLRTCESSGNYRANTGNGFYGAYQFDLGTWHGLGYAGRPSDAAPATQDAAAARLQASRGWSPWPSCARRLGLGAITVSRARALPPRLLASTAAAPAFPGHVLSTADVRSARGDVAQWQRRMRQRGWDLSVDGHFGPQSAGVATRFAAEKHLSPAAKGTVDAAVWAAAWALPVS